jgi:hypothetical protein
MLHLGKLQPFSKYYSKLKSIAGDKHSSLVRESVNYGRKKSFIKLGSGASFVISFIVQAPGVFGLLDFF